LKLAARSWIVVAAALSLIACGEVGPAASSPAAPDTAPVAASPQVLLDLQGSGDKSTQTFTVAGNWDLQWSYDCTAGLSQNGVIPPGYHCSFIVNVKTSAGHRSIENQGVSQLGVKDQSVEHFHTGGTFYLEVQVCCADNSWAIKVTG
jgi:predicted small lipoprotein YifL